MGEAIRQGRHQDAGLPRAEFPTGNRYIGYWWAFPLAVHMMGGSSWLFQYLCGEGPFLGSAGWPELGPNHDDSWPEAFIHGRLKRPVVVGNVPEEVPVFDPCICQGSVGFPDLALNLL